jgi:hypothetical protein
MKIIAHTKYGVFTGREVEYSDENYKETCEFLEKLYDMNYFTFGTEAGKVYMTKEMIADSLFVLEK